MAGELTKYGVRGLYSLSDTQGTEEKIQKNQDRLDPSTLQAGRARRFDIPNGGHLLFYSTSIETPANPGPTVPGPSDVTLPHNHLELQFIGSSGIAEEANVQH